MSSGSCRLRAVAIETSGRIGSVALGCGGHLLDSVSFSADLRHGVELLPTIDGLTRRHGWPAGRVEHFYVSAGPGSFTGLRIGVTVARTLALASGARLVAVPTVEVLASNALELDEPPQHLAVVLDAKRRQVYGAVFVLAGGTYVASVQACVISPAELLARAPRPLALLGEGIDYHRRALQAPDVTILPPATWRARAEAVYRLGWLRARQGRFSDPRSLVPIYLRRPEAEELWDQRYGPPSRH